MANQPPCLTVRLSPKAETQLDEIFPYKLERRGLANAERYLEFLREKIEGLEFEYSSGKQVEVRPELKYILMKPRPSGDGHIAVYRIDKEESVVQVLHIFHTKQDWQNRL